MTQKSPYSGQDMIGDDTPLEEIRAFEDESLIKAKIEEFRAFLLSLPSDDARWQAIGSLDFCDWCGADTRERSCYCRRDD